MPTTKTLKANSTLFQEGDLPDSLFILVRGAISIRKNRINLKSAAGLPYLELSKATAGEILGELSFFDRKPRSASAVALIDTEVIVLSFVELDRLYESVPDYMKKIIESMADRLRGANEQIKVLEQKINSIHS